MLSYVRNLPARTFESSSSYSSRCLASPLILPARITPCLEFMHGASFIP